MKLAISYLTAGKIELVKQSLPVLIDGARNNQFHLFVIDGSDNEQDEKALWEIAYPTANIRNNVRGGAGAAIVYALTEMLKHEENYSHVGLVENDVLLGASWFYNTADLFNRARADGLEAGAVSARAYTDRVLFQRDGYAAVHNIGAGMIVLTREAAKIVLRTFRTAWSSDNRRIFAQLAGVDIGTYWAFRGEEHYLTADWHWEVALASRGLAALSLTPSPVEMIGQNPPLAEQGLTIVKEPVEARRDDEAFKLFAHRLGCLRDGVANCAVETQFHFDPNTGSWTYFPHQMAMLGGAYTGDWRLKEARGWGTFAWEARKIVEEPVSIVGHLEVPFFGACAVLVSGGKTGGKFHVFDTHSGFTASPDLPPEGEQGSVLQLMVPGGMNYRTIRITALTPGCVFYGLQSRERQPFLPGVSFSHANLPRA